MMINPQDTPIIYETKICIKLELTTPVRLSPTLREFMDVLPV